MSSLWKWMNMNTVLALTTLITLPLLLPVYHIFKLLRLIKANIFRENVAGKVVLITGASSGIGEHLAYEYAKRGARLGLAARREDRLRAVAEKAERLGSPDVVVVRADVSRFQDCKTFVDEAVNHFGQLDYLVNNAGIAQPLMFEDCNYENSISIMDINFWGSVNCTRFAVPHLKKNKGKIVGIASAAAWMPTPKMSFYNASKAAVVSFYETLRAEFGSQIGITIVTPGLIESEITTTDFLSEFGLQFSQMESTQEFAKAVVDSACRGDKYLTVPSSSAFTFLVKVLFPDMLEWLCHRQLINIQNSLKKDK